MKVLMVNKFLYPNGGSETYMFKLGEYLVSHGHEVQYFGMEHERRRVGNRVNAYTSSMDFHGGSRLSKISYPLKTIYSFEARRQIRKVLEDFQPDAVHLNNFNYQLTPSILLEIVSWRTAAKRPCRIVYTAHDYQLVCPNHMLRNPNRRENCEKCLGGHFANCVKGKCIHGSTLKSAVGMAEAVYWNMRGAYKYIDAIICPSNFVKSKLDTNPLFQKKTVVIPNFIDAPEYKRQPSGRKYVLYFGRLSEEKGVRTLLEVCKALPEIPFVFAGSGPLSDEVKNVGNIDFRGFQQGEALWNLIADAAFCVCPSEWNEAFGLTIGEAMALGTPALASNIGGIPETVAERKNGELFAPGNVRELTEAIRDLWNDEGKIAEYSKAAQASERLSVGKYYAQLVKIGRGGVFLITPDASRYVLYFGRLSEEKGAGVLLDAAKRLPETRFILAGKGPMEDAADSAENIQTVGFVSGRLLHALISRAEFAVSPSVCMETFGLSNGEAVKLGVPVITTNLGAFPEMILDGKNGCLVKAGDADALEKAIRKLWTHSGELEHLRAGCRETELLSAEEYGKRVLDAYSQNMEGCRMS